MLGKHPQPQTTQLGHPTRIVPGRVETVDPDRWSVDVLPEGTDRIIEDVPVMSLYMHPKGSGLYYLPEEGTHGLLVFFERGRPRFLCCDEETFGSLGFKGEKIDLQPGEMALVTRAGSRLVMRKSGVIEVISTPLLEYRQFPMTHKHFLRGENLDIQLVGGRMTWQHHRDDERVQFVTQVKDQTIHGHKLTLSMGYHDDRSLWKLLYEDPTITGLGGLPGGHEEKRKVLVRVGDLDEGTGKRVDIDVDDGMYTLSLGEKEDGTVLRQMITDHKSGEREWREETEVGLQDNGVVVHREVEHDDVFDIDEKIGKQSDGVVLERVTDVDGDLTLTEKIGKQADGRRVYQQLETADGNDIKIKWGDMSSDVIMEVLFNDDKLKFTVKKDGQVDLSINADKATLQIDADGNTTFNTEGNLIASVDGNVELDADGHVHVVSDDCRLGTGDADQQAVLGNLWMTLYNAFITAYNAHQHVGNLGSPTGPPIAPAQSMSTTQLSDKVRVKK